MNGTEENKIEEIKEESENIKTEVKNNNEEKSSIEVISKKVEVLDTKKKIIIVVSVILLLAVIIGAIIYFTRDKEPEDIITINNNKEILNGADVDGIKISNISLKAVNGNSEYRAVAENTTEEVRDLTGYSITFYENEKEVGTIEVYINKELEPGEKYDLTNFSDMDLSRATAAKYEVVSQ